MVNMKHDLLADAFTVMRNAEFTGKKECVTPASKLIKNILLLMQSKGYIGDFELVDDGKGGRFKVQLLGRINNCGVIKPRFSVRKEEFASWEKRFLPAKGMGMLMLSTSAGVIEHENARKGNTGGRLLGYVY